MGMVSPDKMIGMSQCGAERGHVPKEATAGSTSREVCGGCAVGQFTMRVLTVNNTLPSRRMFTGDNESSVHLLA